MPIFSIAEKKGFGELCFLTFWESFLNLESVGSNFVLGTRFATFWLFIFGSRDIPCCILDVALSTPIIYCMSLQSFRLRGRLIILLQEKKHFFTIAWQSYTFCRSGFVFGRQPDVGGFLWKLFSGSELFCISHHGDLWVKSLRSPWKRNLVFFTFSRAFSVAFLVPTVAAIGWYTNILLHFMVLFYVSYIVPFFFQKLFSIYCILCHSFVSTICRYIEITFFLGIYWHISIDTYFLNCYP